MFALKIQSFMLILIFFESQILFSMTEATQALPIVAVTSLSMSPCLLTTLPRYIKDSTCFDRLSIYCDLYVSNGVDLYQPVTVDVVAKCVKGSSGHL